MSDYKVLIVGYGTVGQNLHKELSALSPIIYDKYKERYTKRPCDYVLRDGTLVYSPVAYDIAFICVDTPLDQNNRLDITEVRNAINENLAGIYVIKSTCPIGTTDLLMTETGKKIVYSPEYYGGTQHCNNFEFNFTILGGFPSHCRMVQQILQNCYDARHTFHIVESKTAELVKFMENSWIATKVSFCTQFYNIAQNHDIDYETLRELFILDPRVNPSHTFVYSDHPYWDSHCLNKDVLHIADSEECATLLQDMITFNNQQKNACNAAEWLADYLEHKKERAE